MFKTIKKILIISNIINCSATEAVPPSPIPVILDKNINEFSTHKIVLKSKEDSFQGWNFFPSNKKIKIIEISYDQEEENSKNSLGL